MKKILVVVDVQKDFYHPEGALYVKGGEVLPERIAKVIPQFDDVVFTLDWHPYNHCSFKENGGIWPKHCVAHSEGSSLPEEFLPFICGMHDDGTFNIEYSPEGSGILIDLKQLDPKLISHIVITKNAQMLKSWQIILIIVGSVVLIGGGVTAALIVRKKKRGSYGRYDKI